MIWILNGLDEQRKQEAYKIRNLSKMYQTKVWSPVEDFDSCLSGIVCCILILQWQIKQANNQNLWEHNFIFNNSGKESNSSLRLSVRLLKANQMHLSDTDLNRE